MNSADDLDLSRVLCTLAELGVPGARAFAVRIGDTGEALFDQRPAARMAVRQSLGVLLNGAHVAVAPVGYSRW